MKRICVITGSRAEYGLLKWVMKGLKESHACDLQTVVTGMHLSPEFGMTSQTIEADGFAIDWAVEMLLGSDTAVGVTKSMGLGMIGFADAYDKLRPNMIVILGDRFEILAAASAALIAGIPIAHLHGGEVTQGAYDDAIRHALTKMSHLHFTAADSYRNRVIQMGEDPDRVWSVGGFGVDSINRLDKMSRAELEKSLDFSFGSRNLLVTFHPETASGADPQTQMHAILEALKNTDAHLIFTMPNADNEGRVIFKMIEDFVRKHPEQSCVHISLGQRRYLSALAHVDAVVGNSSSGLLEVPAFGKGTVNIGSRQDGRLRAKSVIDCPAQTADIQAAVKKVLDPEFTVSIIGASNPYGTGGASERTVEVLESWEPYKAPKTFFDIAISTEK